MSGRMCSWKNTQGIFFVVPWVCLRSLSASTMAFCVYIRQSNDNEFREIKLRLVKFDLETLLFNKAHFCEVLYLLQWVSFSGKDYYVLLLVLLVLNKFIEINTLIKRNLNFKCEVKSHKVRLQAYCNKPLLKWIYLYLSITWLHSYDVTSTWREVATRLQFKRCTCSRFLVTVAPAKVNIWLFV